MLTLPQLREHYPGYWVTGTGPFAVICPSAKRVTLFQTLAEALPFKSRECGPGCDRSIPHKGYRLYGAPVRRLHELGWEPDNA
jgi:hypothetical protein